MNIPTALIRSSLLLGLLFVAILTSLTGCGSSSGSEQPSAAAETKPLTPQQASREAAVRKRFLKQANHLCARVGREQFVAVGKALKHAKAHGQKESEALEAAAREVMIPHASQMVSELESIKAPAADQTMVGEIFSYFSEGLSQAKKQPSEFVEGELFAPADKAAEAYGLTKCQL